MPHTQNSEAGSAEALLQYSSNTYNISIALTNAMSHPEQHQALALYTRHFPRLSRGAGIRGSEVVVIVSRLNKLMLIVMAALEVILSASVGFGTSLLAGNRNVGLIVLFCTVAALSLVKIVLVRFVR